jgi:hypothetical protein
MKAGGKQSSAYSWTLKMEAICSSEISVGFQRTTRRYIPEDNTLQKENMGKEISYGMFLHAYNEL